MSRAEALGTNQSGATLSPEEIQHRVSQFEWYHSIDLGGGVVTPGIFNHEPLLPLYGIPESLRGKTVLDIGPGHGFFAFEFERRGAEKVVTAELPSWVDHDASPALAAVAASIREAGEAYHREAFGFAIDALGSRVERRFCNEYDLTPERVGVFDFVFCGSVLQHLSDPLRALWAIRRVCRDVARDRRDRCVGRQGVALGPVDSPWSNSIDSPVLASNSARPGRRHGLPPARTGATHRTRNDLVSTV